MEMMSLLLQPLYLVLPVIMIEKRKGRDSPGIH